MKHTQGKWELECERQNKAAFKRILKQAIEQAEH